jgi:hypothetical protein
LIAKLRCIIGQAWDKLKYGPGSGTPAQSFSRTADNQSVLKNQYYI